MTEPTPLSYLVRQLPYGYRVGDPIDLVAVWGGRPSGCQRSPGGAGSGQVGEEVDAGATGGGEEGAGGVPGDADEWAGDA